VSSFPTTMLIGRQERGIEVEDSGRVEISDNAVYESDDDGIRVSNSHAYDDDGSYSVEVLRNIVDVSGDDGIEVTRSGRTHIDGNTVSRSGDDGIVVSGVYASDFYLSPLSRSLLCI
jgi:parallel beta-helix repeat protein